MKKNIIELIDGTIIDTFQIESISKNKVYHYTPSIYNLWKAVTSLSYNIQMKSGKEIGFRQTFRTKFPEPKEVKDQVDERLEIIKEWKKTSDL